MQNEPLVPLEYATGLRPPGDAAKARAVRRRLIGAARQGLFAAGLSTAAYGLGASIASGWADAGPQCMLIGGAVVGLSTPFRRGDRV